MNLCGIYSLIPPPLLLCAIKYLLTDIQEIIKRIWEHPFKGCIALPSTHRQIHMLSLADTALTDFKMEVVCSPWAPCLVLPFPVTAARQHCLHLPLCHSKLLQLMKDFAFMGQVRLSQFIGGRFTFDFSGAHESLQHETDIDFP